MEERERDEEDLERGIEECRGRQHYLVGPHSLDERASHLRVRETAHFTAPGDHLGRRRYVMMGRYVQH